MRYWTTLSWPFTTGEVKWSSSVVVHGDWAAATCSNEVSHQIQVAIIGGVVQRSVSLAVFDSITVTGNMTLGKILPAPVSSKMKQRDLSYLFVIQKWLKRCQLRPDVTRMRVKQSMCQELIPVFESVYQSTSTHYYRPLATVQQWKVTSTMPLEQQ